MSPTADTSPLVIRQATLSDARAIAFYSRWGFTDVGAQHFQLGADRQTDRIMARRIAAQE